MKTPWIYSKTEVKMRIEEAALKGWTGFLIYMVAYNGLALVIYDLDVTLFQWLIRPIIDLYYLNIVAIVMLISSMVSFFFAFNMINKNPIELIKSVSELELLVILNELKAKND